MTASASLITGFVKRPAASGDSFVMLEQQSWDPKIGKVTRLDLIKALENSVLGSSNSLSVDCGVDFDGQSYTTIVYAYPSPADLRFKVGLTNGEFTAPTVVELTVREAVSFALETEQSLTYPVRRFVAAEWAADVWNEAGSVVARPAITRDGQTMSVPEPIYGTAYVEYTTVRYVYSANIPARSDDPENVFQSIFYAWWDGGIELLKLSAPDGAESSYSSQMNCWGERVLINPDDEDDPAAPSMVPTRNKEITLNYCDDF